jgi:hypothetical protein
MLCMDRSQVGLRFRMQRVNTMGICAIYVCLWYRLTTQRRTTGSAKTYHISQSLHPHEPWSNRLVGKEQLYSYTSSEREKRS